MALRCFGREFLRVGDHIVLKCPEVEASLSAEGILSESLHLEKKIDYIDDFIFCIHLRRRYSAYHDYNDYIQEQTHPSSSAVKGKNAADPMYPAYNESVRRSLLHGKEMEMRLNDFDQGSRFGEVVNFGSIIQLFHVKSGKYLTVMANKLAQFERENLRVTLDKYGSEASWIQLLPRFKMDSEGDAILSSADVYLKFAGRTKAFLRYADESPPGHTWREINCSLERSAWQIHIFHSSIDLRDCRKKRRVLPSQIVFLHDLERQCSLALADTHRNLGKASERLNVMKSHGKLPTNVSRTGAPVFEYHVDADSVPTRALWVVEKVGRIEGGLISWRSESVRFKHLNTGLYLCLKEKQLQSPLSARTDAYSFGFTDDRDDPTTCISVEDIDLKSVHLQYRKPVRIIAKSMYVDREQAEGGLHYTPRLTEQEDKAILFEICDYMGERSWKHANGRPSGDSVELSYEFLAPEVSLQAPMSKQKMDLYATISARKHLQTYNSMITRDRYMDNQKVKSIWPSASSSSLRFLSLLIDKMILFAQGKDYSSSSGINGSDGYDYGEENVSTGSQSLQPIIDWRQYLLRDQYVIQDLLSLLSKLTPISMWQKSRAQVRRTDLPHSKNIRPMMNSVISLGHYLRSEDDDDELYERCQLAVQKCLLLLHMAIRGNHRNQCSVAPDMKVLLGHLEAQPQAGLCIEELLKNDIIQQASIGQREIDIFIEMLRKSRMSEMYLRLLLACCSCNGRGMNLNQCYIAEQIFGDTENDLTIHMELMKPSDEFTPIFTAHKSVYIPAEINKQAIKNQLMGYAILKASFPRFALSWSTSSVDLSALALFGCMQVDLMDFTNTDINNTKMYALLGSKKTNKNALTLSDIKAGRELVLSYFVTQLTLAAETCADRNYIAMKTIHDKFPYEVLIMLLKLNVNDALNAAVMRLLLHLHIDREPQRVICVPRMSRVLEDIITASNDAASFTTKPDRSSLLLTVEDSDAHKFGLIQHLISEHVRGMAGSHWTEYSLFVLQVLRALVSFNFYGTPERIADVIQTLMQALDRRNVRHNVRNTNHIIGSSWKGEPTEPVPHHESMVSTMFRRFFRAKTQPENNDAKSYAPLNQSEIDTRGASKMPGTPESISPQRPNDAGSHEGKERTVPDNDDLKENFARRLGTGLREFLDGKVFAVIILSVVALAMVNTIVTIIHGAEYKKGSKVWWIDLAVVCSFAVEMMGRILAWGLMDNMLGCFGSIYTQADMVVLIISVTFLVLRSEVAVYVQLIKSIRLIHTHKLFEKSRGSTDLLGGSQKSSEYIQPLRYTKSPSHEMLTMIEALQVLRKVQDLIDDRNLTVFLQAYHRYDKGFGPRNPVDVFNHVLRDISDMTVIHDGWEQICVDILLYSHDNLVQSTLEVLMAHYTIKHALLTNASTVQLLVTTERQNDYRKIESMLYELQSNADSHEVWGGLLSTEYQTTNKRTAEILDVLIEMSRVPIEVLSFGHTHTPVPHIQNLLHDLGFFETAMSILRLLHSITVDSSNGKATDSGENIRLLCRKCTQLLYWFTIGNFRNQTLVFDKLDFFFDSLDAGIRSHTMLQAILYHNEPLMRKVPHSMIGTLVENLSASPSSERCAHDLVLMVSMTNFRNKGIPENQSAVFEALTGKGLLHSSRNFFVPISSPAYKMKVDLMKQVPADKDVHLDDLPGPLAYHAYLIELLSGCTVGVDGGITAIEAQIQSCYDHEDVIDAIMDPLTPHCLKLRLVCFLFDVFIDVETNIGGLESSPGFWKLFDYLLGVFDTACNEIAAMKLYGWDACHTQKLEFYIQCIHLVGGFFAKYSAVIIYYIDEDSDGGPLSADTMQDIISELSHRIWEISELDCERFGPLREAYIEAALIALQPLQLHGGRHALRLRGAKPFKRQNIPSAAEMQRSQGHLRSKLDYVDRFQDFVETLYKDGDVKTVLRMEKMAFVRVLEALPTMSEGHEGSHIHQNQHIFQRTILHRLIAHISGSIVYTGTAKQMAPRYTRTAIWIIRAFRSMIENKMGMSIYDRDREGGEDEDIAAASMVEALHTSGAVTLCLDLIAVGIDTSLQTEAIKLAVAMLFKEGGSLVIQEAMYVHLSTSKSRLFFKQVHLTIMKLKDWVSWQTMHADDLEDKKSLPDELILLRFLQLMSEGHYLHNQDIMREQPNNDVEYKILDDLVEYLNVLSRSSLPSAICAESDVCGTILELIQGPCTGNQYYFAMKTNLLHIIQDLLRMRIEDGDMMEEQVNIKKRSLAILCGLLEGQSLDSVVYQKLLSLIHLDVIVDLSKDPASDSSDQKFRGIKQRKSYRDMAKDSLRSASRVFLQMLFDSKPSLRDEVASMISDKKKSIPDGGRQAGRQTGIRPDELINVEIDWNGQLIRKYFREPDTCKDLDIYMRNQLLEEVDRSGLDRQHADFVKRAEFTYCQLRHQEYLKSLGVSGVFSTTNHGRATWITFILAYTINYLIYWFYTLNEEGQPEVPDVVKPVLTFLNIFQLIVAIFTLILSLVTRSPVTYQTLEAKGHRGWELILLTVCERMTIYYVTYVAICFLGLLVADFYLSLLLLDIAVKNSTTRDVLKSVVAPAQQIFWTLLLVFIVIYIFAFFIFKHYPNEFEYDDDSVQELCETMWHCFLATLFSITQGGGFADTARFTLDNRIVLDLAFFVILMTVLVNVLFGIIIDTFASLRQKKAARKEATENYCFICGIDKLTFDRADDTSHGGFQRHIDNEHNMWNYLKFMVYLWEQDRDDDDGLEWFVRSCISAKSQNWLPRGKSMHLSTLESDDEGAGQELRHEVQRAHAGMHAALSDLEGNVEGKLEELTQKMAGEKSRQLKKPLVTHQQYEYTYGYEKNDMIIRSAKSLGPQGADSGDDDDDDGDDAEVPTDVQPFEDW